MGEDKENPEDETMVWYDKVDGKEYRLSFEHAKILYLVSHYARSSKSDEQPETWIRDLSLDVLLYEGICAGKLDFDYAPISGEFLYAGDGDEVCVKRCYMNISQEARSAIGDLMEQDFIKSLKVPNDDNATTIAYQASQKGMDLLQALPPVLRIEVDDFLYKRNGYKDRVHPTKDLLKVVTDEEGFILVTPNGFEERSGLTQVEDVSYVTSPFLPWTYRHGETPCTDNSTRAWESGVGISQVKRELKESIVLSQVNILIQEWIPTAANEFCGLLDRFGVKTRNAGGRFTAFVDRHPNRQSVHTQQGLTRVELLDYNTRCVNFEAELQFAEDEGVKQVEFIGIHLHTMGSVSCGVRVEAIQNRLADDVSCDLMSRMMVDLIQDTSLMLNDLLTSSQIHAMETVYRGNSLSRSKFCLTFADKAEPMMKAAAYKDGGEYENELRQVLGEIRVAQDIGVGGEIIIQGTEGMLIIGRRLRKYDRITVMFGEVTGMLKYMKNTFLRMSVLGGQIVKLRETIELGDEDPTSFETVRKLRNEVAADLATVEEVIEYLTSAAEHMSIPNEPLEDIGKALFNMLDIKGGLKALDNQLNDIRKLVRGARVKVDGFGKEVRILQTKKERAAGLALDQNTKRMVEVSHAYRRSAAVFGFLHQVLGCSFGLLMLDAFISARSKYFGMKDAYELAPGTNQSAEEGFTTPDFAAISNVEVGDPTVGGSYFPMQAALILDQAPLVGTFAIHLLFMGSFLYLMQRMEAFFDASGVRTVACKFWKKINPEKLDEYIGSKALGHLHSIHVESGEDRGEGICEKVVRFVPAAPFPWTWHGVAPEIEMRVDLAKQMLVSASFKRGESLPFWKWLVYNQLLRRSQKMSMISHYDQYMVERFLSNLTEADVFTEWDPKAKEPKPSDEITIKEVTVEEGGNPLDVLNMENRQEPTVDVEAIDVEYDPWSQDPEAARPPRSGDQPVYDSEGPSRAETGDASQYEESEGPTRVNTAVENSGKNEESATTNGKFGFGSLFKRKQ